MANYITYTVPRFPLLNQRTEASNANDDCVFTSCAAIVTALTGRAITGTQIKAMDNNYGPKYVGVASAANLVDTMDKLGVILTRRASSTQAGLVTLIHQAVSAGNPCLITMPSQWNSAVTNAGSHWNPRAYNGYSHVGAACGLGKNSLGKGMMRVMNPWGGFWQDGTDLWWADRLLTGAIWVATRKPSAVAAPVAAATAKPATAPTTPVAATTPALTDAEKLAEIAKILAV